jgi:predicted metalloprotease with PDZ domain
LSVNDEIIGCNGYRVNQGSLEATMNSLNNGETVELLISRDEILYSIEVNMTSFTKPQFKLKIDEGSPYSSLTKYWLREQK